MIQNLICGVYLLLSDFPAENLKVNKNQRKRSFILQFSLTSLTNLEPRNIVKYILPSTTKNLNHFTNFPANMFLVDVRKNICTYHFYTGKSWILVTLGKQMSVYSCKSLKVNFCSGDVGSVYLVGWGRGGLSNCLKTTRCLGSLKCFRFFPFN